MKIFLRILSVIVIVLILAVGGGITYLMTAFPKVGPAEDITVEATPERIARGDYLANHVTVCIDCHATRNWDYFTGPIVAGTEGKGGERFGEEFGFPGTFYSKNITPSGIGDWTDGELIRMITTGVNKDGEPTFPVMPYPYYAILSKEDVYSIVAYIRTLEPIENEVPDPQYNFPVNFIVRTIPKPAEPQPEVDRTDTLAYGKYLVTISGCYECHTPHDGQGQKLAGMDFAGGFEFALSGGIVRSENITPDETGIVTWTKGNFIEKFKNYTRPETHVIPLDKEEVNTVMPWTMYAAMTEEDLGAMYAYLRTVGPVKHKVERYEVKKLTE